MKAAFVEREYPADFDEQLAELIADFDAATGDTDAGLQEQTGGTAGMIGRRGMKAVRELDAMITKKLRTSNPALLQVWKNTSRLQRPSTAPSTPPPATKSVMSKEPQMPMANRDAAGTSQNGHEVDARAEVVEPPVNGTDGASLA